MTEPVLGITLAVIIATLFAIVYSLRILVIMERRVASLEMHIKRLVEQVLKEEHRIEKRLGMKRKTTKKNVGRG